MIRFEVASSAELMAAYQAIMVAKFGAGADTGLQLSEPLAVFADRVVDQLVVATRQQHGEAAAAALADWRLFQPHYPQAVALAAAIRRWDWWPGAGREQRAASVRRFLAPLQIDADILEPWLQDQPPVAVL